VPASSVSFQETVKEALAVTEIRLAGEPSEGRFQIQEMTLCRRVQDAKNTRGSEAVISGGCVCVSLVDQDVCFQLLG
jgi:hypothetical protein